MGRWVLKVDFVALTTALHHLQLLAKALRDVVLHLLAERRVHKLKRESVEACARTAPPCHPTPPIKHPINGKYCTAVWWQEPPILRTELHHALVSDLLPLAREAVAGRPSRAFPCSYEPLSARDPRCRRRNEATAPIASSSFAAADGVRGHLRDGARPALRGRALRAPPRKSWPAPFSAGNSGLSALSRVLLGDRTCLCLPNTRPRTHPPRHPARRRPRCCRPASSL